MTGGRVYVQCAAFPAFHAIGFETTILMGSWTVVADHTMPRGPCRSRYAQVDERVISVARSRGGQAIDEVYSS